MKKIFVALIICSFLISSAEAKDYAKTQIKEMKHAQKYGTTQTLFQNQVQTPSVSTNSLNVSNIKDPKIMKIGNYEKIGKTEFDEKIKNDEQKYNEYAKLLGKKHSKYYTTQADTEDYYKIYRIAEKIIRANRLDFINWRICLYNDTNNPNAYTANVNQVAISTSLFDTFSNNDDAIALVLGHEMGHALLGHLKRSRQLLDKMERQQALAQIGNSVAATVYIAMKRKFIIDSKNMEYAADVEGAKLAMRAGYNLDKASEVLTFLATYDLDKDIRNTHPSGAKRLENFNENSKYFLPDWKEAGKYNIYNSEVLPVSLSSDKKSMVITAPQNRLSSNKYYKPETMEELYARFGYMCYLNGEFEKSLENFEQLFKTDTTNAPAYLYASYAAEYLYKNTKNSKYLKLAKEYANNAQKIDSQNQYINEQVKAL